MIRMPVCEAGNMGLITVHHPNALYSSLVERKPEELGVIGSIPIQGILAL